MAIIGSLSLLLGVDLKGWGKGLKAAGGQADKFFGKVDSAAKSGASALDPLANHAKGYALGLAGLATSALAAAAAGAALASSIDRIDSLTDSAQRLGTTTDALSELRYAADLTGSSADDLDAALEKLSANLGDSAVKATPASDALKRLGLEAKDLAAQDPAKAFAAIVKGFEKIPSASEKASLAMDIFGKGGIKILNTLSAGDQLGQLAEEARRFGVSISQVDAAKIGAAKDSLDRANKVIEGIGNTLAIELAPLIEVVGGKFAEWTADTVQGGGLVAQVLDKVAGAIGGVGNAWQASEKATQSAFADIIEGSGSVLDFFGGSGEGARDIAKTFREDIERGFDVKPSDQLGAFLADIKKKAQYAAEATAKITPRDSGNSALTKAISDVTDKLKEQADTFGKGAAAVELYKLEQLGATKAELAAAQAQADRIQGLEDEKKNYEELKGFAKGYWESSLTAAQKYQVELGRIAAATEGGLIGPETAIRAAKKAGKDSGLNETKLAGATELGSTGAYSSIVSALTGKGDGLADVAKSSTMTANNTGLLVAEFRNMAKALGKEPTVDL